MSEKKADGGGQDAGLKSAIRAVAATAGVLALGAIVIANLRFGMGVLVGGAIAVANLIVLARIVQAFLDKGGRTAPWVVIAIFKLVLLLGGVYLILKSGVVSGVSLVIGYMALPVGAVVASVFGPKPPEDK
jgi:hypothetical protein